MVLWLPVVLVIMAYFGMVVVNVWSWDWVGVLLLMTRSSTRRVILGVLDGSWWRV